ncbi:hypothetical protein ALT761_02248 [Alteromonas sp. 76-1]|jgi:hypothetical protein|uniref:hypothetical protein n=1 Tax=Alteromonas sp. 76-1 TaxID=2358187 RepID=UPI000FD166A1|nr:hypothetical protein [Alteromonas sp. 76-1]VEL97247.1 hypothetical protein ALT761_02248 [Alteromonas sp. 76-1]
MTLLSHQLFDHCDTSVESPEPCDQEICAPQLNPGSGLPLIKNSSVDIGGYIIGDGPLNHDDEAVIAIIDDCIEPFDLAIEPTFVFEASNTFDDTFSISDDFCSLNDEWI